MVRILTFRWRLINSIRVFVVSIVEDPAMKKQIVVNRNSILEKETVSEEEKIALHKINVGFVSTTAIRWSIA